MWQSCPPEIVFASRFLTAVVEVKESADVLISTGSKQSATNHINVTYSVAGLFQHEVDKAPPTTSVLHIP